jgi:hypothetical protein
MGKEIEKISPTGQGGAFERIRRTNAAGNEYWSSRDFAQVLGYTDYRNFEQVIRKAKTACFNSGQRIEDHFGDVTDMIENRQRRLKTQELANQTIRTSRTKKVASMAHPTNPIWVGF